MQDGPSLPALCTLSGIYTLLALYLVITPPAVYNNSQLERRPHYGVTLDSRSATTAD